MGGSLSPVCIIRIIRKQGGSTMSDSTFLKDRDIQDDIDLTPEKRTVLDDIKSALAKPVEKAPITLEVPGRPDMAVRFDTNIDADLLQAWTKRCTKRVKGEPEVDTMRLASIVIASKAETVVYRNEDVDFDGKPLNFQNTELGEMLRADSRSHLGVIRALYGYDGHILGVMNEILRAAGFDPDVDIQEEDEDSPTKRS
jgi:hypothetical protein